MKCPHCGNDVPEGKFCMKCGQPLTAPAGMAVEPEMMDRSDTAAITTLETATAPETIAAPETSAEPLASDNNQETVAELQASAQSETESQPQTETSAEIATQIIGQPVFATDTAVLPTTPVSANATDTKYHATDTANSTHDTADTMVLSSKANGTFASADQPESASEPIATIPVASAAAPATTAAKPKRHVARMVAWIVAAALVVTGGATMGALAYRGKLPWQPVEVPTVDQIAATANTDKSKLTAVQVQSVLETQGIKTELTHRYSGIAKGGFVGFANVKDGEKIARATTVQITESDGPGVPKGTVGQTATDAQATLESMNVPVIYRSVHVSADAKTAQGQSANGTVMGSYPADGEPVSDTSKGIEVAVGTSDGAGIPVDYFGQDPDQVQSALEKTGFTVVRKAKFSTKQNVGKVVATYPALGSTVDSTNMTVIEFYGVDATSTKDVFTDPGETQQAKSRDDYFNFSPNPAGYYGNDGVEAAYGIYCTKDGSKCKTLGNRFSQQLEYDDQANSFTNSSDLPKLFVCSTLNTTYPCLGKEDQGLGDSLNPLVYGSTGAFEITDYAQLSTVSCGGTGSDKKDLANLNARVADFQAQGFDDEVKKTDTSCSANATFDMDDDWYVYMPVGADLASVESAGYFDADALKDAQSKPQPDADTPYIVVRDASQYDFTSLPASDYSKENTADGVAWYYRSPFVEFLGNSNRVGMKPAPTDDDVYYLVEDPFDLENLTNYPTTNVNSASAQSTGSTEADDFSSMASDAYMFSSGAGASATYMNLSKSGNVRISSTDWDMGTDLTFYASLASLPNIPITNDSDYKMGGVYYRGSYFGYLSDSTEENGFPKVTYTEESIPFGPGEGYVAFDTQEEMLYVFESRLYQPYSNTSKAGTVSASYYAKGADISSLSHETKVLLNGLMHYTMNDDEAASPMEMSCFVGGDSSGQTVGGVAGFRFCDYSD